MVEAIVAAIGKGGLFAVDVDIVPTKIGQACHVWLPAATAGEMNLTSMNGERRMRLTERYMDPPGQAMPDCLIAARLGQQPWSACSTKWASKRKPTSSKASIGRLKKTPSWTAIMRMPKAASLSLTIDLRAMGTNGVQEPATEFENGKLVGTKRLFSDGKFGTKSSKATFMATQWRGFEAPGKEEKSKKFAFLINNGHANHVWQSAYLDQNEDLVTDRYPIPYIQMNPEDMEEVWGCRRVTLLKSTTTMAQRKQWPIRPRPPGASRPSCFSLTRWG